MARFMDVHRGVEGLTAETVHAAHKRDLEIEGQEGVHFVQAWADPSSGIIFCLSEGPDVDAVKRVHERAGHPTEEIYEVPIVV